MTQGISRVVAITLATWMTIAAAACASSSDSDSGAATGTGASSAADWAAGKCAQVGAKTCANDAPTTASGHDQCEAARADAKCGARYVAYLQCIGGKVTCTSEGKVDTAKLLAPCIDEFTQHEFCVRPITFDAGVLDGGSGG